MFKATGELTQVSSNSPPSQASGIPNIILPEVRIDPGRQDLLGGLNHIRIAYVPKATGPDFATGVVLLPVIYLRLGAAALLHQIQNKRRQDQFHRKAHFPSRHDY